MNRLLTFVLLCIGICSASAVEALGSSSFIPEDMPRTGYFTDVFKDPETKKDLIRYCIKTPAKLPDRRTLILIADFHGCGGNEESFKWVKTNYPGIDDSQLMWVGMKSQGRCWAASDHQRITQCMDWVVKTYPIDQRRIFYRGYSSGAFLQSSYGAKHQDTVAGYIQYAGGGGIPSYSKDPENFAAEFYLACGEKDKFYTSAILKEEKSLLGSKYRYVLRAWDQHDHTSHFNQNDPQVAVVSEDILNWAWSIRHKTRGLYNEDLAFLKTIKKMKDSEIWTDKKIVNELIRIGGHEAGHFIVDALKSKEETIMLQAIDACMQVNFSNDVTNVLAKLFVKDKNEKIRAACGQALNRLAPWSHRVAHQGLSAKLGDRKGTEADKLRAIQGIKSCIAFQLHGTYRSHFDLYKALVMALNDESEAVRSAAFKALKPCHDNDYAYDATADKKKRRVAIQGWQAWFAQLIEG